MNHRAFCSFLLQKKTFTFQCPNFARHWTLAMSFNCIVVTLSWPGPWLEHRFSLSIKKKERDNSRFTKINHGVCIFYQRDPIQSQIQFFFSLSQINHSDNQAFEVNILFRIFFKVKEVEDLIFSCRGLKSFVCLLNRGLK